MTLLKVRIMFLIWFTDSESVDNLKPVRSETSPSNYYHDHSSCEDLELFYTIIYLFLFFSS